MGIPHSTARWVAPLSFAIDFAAQQYGMLATPNMKDVHDANLSFWSPQPYFIAGFFFPQQLFQVAWLYRLYKLDPKKSEETKKEVETMVNFVPYYAVGNLCIASKYHLLEVVDGILIRCDSLDDILEQLRTQDGECLCSHKFIHTTILYLRQTTTNEHSFNLINVDPHCFQNLCWNRYPRFPSQWISRLLQPSRANYGC